MASPDKRGVSGGRRATARAADGALPQPERVAAGGSDQPAAAPEARSGQVHREARQLVDAVRADGRSADAGAGRSADAGAGRSADAADAVAREARDLVQAAVEEAGICQPAAPAGPEAVAAQEARELAEVVRETVDPSDPVTDTELKLILAEATPDQPFGRPGPPLTHRSPLRIAFTASAGVALAALLVVAVITARQVLILILVAGFVAVGLDPLVRWLARRRLPRGVAVAVVAVGTVGLIAGFIAAAVPAITTEATQLIRQAPAYLQRASRGHGVIASLIRQLHLVNGAKGASGHLPLSGGLLGIGRTILSTAAATVTVLVLIVYFLSALPTIKRTANRLVSQSRRARVGLLTDEVLRRVGGYMLGNLLTSLIAGAAMTVFLFAVGVPYPVFLGLLVAVADLVPLVGALAAGLVVALVALTVSIPVAVGTVAFTAVFRLLEDYLLTPRVMRSTVDVPPVATIVAVLIGGALLGIVGALLAIPVAAAIDLLLKEVVFPRQDTA